MHSLLLPLTKSRPIHEKYRLNRWPSRSRKLTKQQIDKLIKLVDRMVKEAMAEDEVAQRMILRRTHYAVHERRAYSFGFA